MQPMNRNEMVELTCSEHSAAIVSVGTLNLVSEEELGVCDAAALGEVELVEELVNLPTESTKKRMRIILLVSTN